MLRKRILHILLASSFVLASCSEDSASTGSNAQLNQEGFPIVSEKITLNVMGATNSSLPDDWNDLLVFKKMEELTNIHLDFTLYTSTNYSQKKNLAFASGDLPDLFFKGMLSSQDEMTYGENGILTDLKPYLEYAPNVQQAFLDFPEILPSITLPSGKLVSLPEVNDVPRDRALKMWINKRWLDNLNLEIPQTTQEWEEVLYAFKNNDPNKNGTADEIPLSFASTDHLKHLLSAFGLLYNTYAEDGKVIYSPADLRHKEGLEFFAKLYADGVLDSQSFTQTSEKLAAKGSGDVTTIGCFVNTSPRLVAGAAHQEEYTLLPPLESKDKKRVWLGRNPFGKGAFAMTNTNKYPEATIRYIDYLYGEEGGRLMYAGVEGETYRMAEDGLWDYILPDGVTAIQLQNQIGTNSGAFSPMRKPTDFILKSRPTSSWNLNEEVKKLLPYIVVAYPEVYFSQEETKRVNTLVVDLDSCFEQYMARAITGNANAESDWDTYINQLERIGVKEYVEIHQRNYDDFIVKKQ